MLEGLTKAGYIQKKVSSKDKREFIICLTAKNKKLQAIYEKVSEEVQQIFYQNFSLERMKNFEKDLAQILTNLQKYEA